MNVAMHKARRLASCAAAAIGLASCSSGTPSSVLAPTAPAAAGPAATVAPAASAPTASAAPAASSSIWVTAWGQAMQNASASTQDPASDEQTFRTIVKPTVGVRGTVRVHLSNTVGTAPVTVGAMHVGVVASGAALAFGTDRVATFGGAGGVTIPAGGSVYSDPVAIGAQPYGTLLAVTTYVSGSWASLPEHNDAGIVTHYASAPAAGDRTGDAKGASFTNTSSLVFLVDRLDVYGDYTGTVAFAGSSTTAGFASDANEYDDLVDDVAANLHAAGRDDLGLANMSMSPDGLLAKNVYNADVPILTRFQGDFLSLPHLRTLVQNGADIDLKGACDPATDVIAGEQSAIAQTHAAGARIVLAVIAPSTYCGGNAPGAFGTRFPAGSGEDAQRQLLNAWIVSTAPSIVSGVTEAAPGADAVVDLSTPVTDPANTGYLLPQYNSGDNSHLDPAGQAVQAAAIPLSVL